MLGRQVYRDLVDSVGVEMDVSNFIYVKWWGSETGPYVQLTRTLGHLSSCGIRRVSSGLQSPNTYVESQRGGILGEGPWTKRKKMSILILRQKIGEGVVDGGGETQSLQKEIEERGDFGRLVTWCHKE